ncbi:MAG TPA: hypothetical protein VGG56_11360 [Terracidiphilus sp.]|jgi:hypothetical protein
MTARIAKTLVVATQPLYLLLMLVFLLPVFAVPAWAEDAKDPFPTMAPLDQYLIADRNAEIALARSAAPATISNDAQVLVLEKDGYHVAVEGKNGFTCLVERSWMSSFGSADFWNSKMRGPICYNPPAVRSILLYTLNRTKMALAGLTKAQMAEKVKAQVASKQLPEAAPGAMSYMMSKDGILGGGDVGHWRPHLMFHVPKMETAEWGANLNGSPVMEADVTGDDREPETIFMVAVDHWSDGTPYSSNDMAMQH